MKTFTKLLCCSLFLFFGIIGMKGTTEDVSVLPTQTVAAGTITSSFPALSSGQATTKPSCELFDRVETLDSTFNESNVTSTNNSHKKAEAPGRVVVKTKTRYKYLLFIATPRDREEIPLDSVLADSAGWKVQSATCHEMSKDVIHSVRD